MGKLLKTEPLKKKLSPTQIYKTLHHHFMKSDEIKCKVWAVTLKGNNNIPHQQKHCWDLGAIFFTRDCKMKIKLGVSLKQRQRQKQLQQTTVQSYSMFLDPGVVWWSLLVVLTVCTPQWVWVGVKWTKCIVTNPSFWPLINMTGFKVAQMDLSFSG